ncbi:unnamed protein product [Pedinophyceae sp. YPF-701]|nr:unnamed protein product [Pedinophyceae sp. YPF-701]
MKALSHAQRAQSVFCGRPASSRPVLHRTPARAPTAAVPPKAIFLATMHIALPMYAVLASRPKVRPWAARAVASPWPHLCFAALYVAALASPAIDWSSLSMFTQAALPRAEWFGALFQNRAMFALAWVHLLALDMLQAKYVATDGLRRNIPTAHSLVLCFMVGPLGLVSHTITSWIVARRSGDRAPGLGGAAN